MARVVFHVLVPEGEFDKTLLIKSKSSVPISCPLIESPAIVGHIGRSRAAAFRACIAAHPEAEFLSLIDGDGDEVLDQAVDRSLAVMDADPLVVSTYGNLEIVRPNGDVEITDKPPWSPHSQLCRWLTVHHLHLFRVAAIEPLLDILEQWPAAEEMALTALLVEQGDHARVPGAPLYRWIDNGPDSASRQLITPALKRRAFATATPILMAAHEAGRRQVEGDPTIEVDVDIEVDVTL